MKIALTHTGNPEKHQFYIDWLKAGNDIEIVKLAAEDNNLDELGRCDGLILSGGVDIHPSFYNNKTTNYTDAPERFNEKRDQFEINAFQFAQENNLPVLGICRGLQLINVIHGGTLFQNLDDALSQKHKGNPDKCHQVILEPGTVLSGIIGNNEVQINSAHHQAIDRLGKGLVINAKSTDGVVEGIERQDKEGKPFLLAVQWHPERMFRFQLQDTAASKSIRDRFIKEIKKK